MAEKGTTGNHVVVLDTAEAVAAAHGEVVGVGSSGIVLRFRHGAARDPLVVRYPLKALRFPPPPAASQSCEDLTAVEAAALDDVRRRRCGRCVNALKPWLPFTGPSVIIVRGCTALRALRDAVIAAGLTKVWKAMAAVDGCTAACALDATCKVLFTAGEAMRDVSVVPDLRAHPALGGRNCQELTTLEGRRWWSIELKPKAGIRVAASSVTVTAVAGDTVLHHTVDDVVLHTERFQLKLATKAGAAGSTATCEYSPERLFAASSAATASHLSDTPREDLVQCVLRELASLVACPMNNLRWRQIETGSSRECEPPPPPSVLRACAMVLLVDDVLRSLLHVQTFGVPPGNDARTANVELPALEASLLLSLKDAAPASEDDSPRLVAFGSAASSAQPEVATPPRTPIELTPALLDELTSRFYAATTAKDCTVCLTVAEPEATESDATDEEEIRALDGVAETGRWWRDAASGALIGVHVVDVEAKRHKSLEWYVRHSQEMVDAYSALHGSLC